MRKVCGALAVVHREGAQREGADLGRAVHQVVQVGRGVDQRVVGREELGGHLPRLAGRRHELHPGAARLETLGPHQRGRHVEVPVGRVDAEIGAVGTIAEHTVAHRHRAVVARHVPLMQVRPHRGQRLALAVGDAHVEDVLGELVEGVAARRRAAHPHLEGSGGDVGEGGVHLHPAVLGRGERHAVNDRGLGGGGGRGRRRQQCGEQASGHEGPGKRRHSGIIRRARGPGCTIRPECMGLVATRSSVNGASSTTDWDERRPPAGWAGSRLTCSRSRPGVVADDWEDWAGAPDAYGQGHCAAIGSESARSMSNGRAPDHAPKRAPE